MNILAINTAFNESYVAVKKDDSVVLKNMDSSLKQSENILGLIDQSLDEANIRIDHLDSIACVIGPGSFTGIRIGASLCKGFCFNNKTIKRVPINSLDLVAYTFSKTKPLSSFWVVLNALSGNLFACNYSKDGDKIGEYSLAFGDEISNINGIVVGLEEEGLEICSNFVNLNSLDLLELSEKTCLMQKTSLDFEPLYLRKSQAEAELDKKNENN